jgi:hypothetical protein
MPYGWRHGALGGFQNVPMSVDHEPGIGLVMFQDDLDRSKDLGEFRRIELGLRIFRCVTGGNKEGIPFAKRNLEGVREPDEHLATWLRLPGLEPTHVTRRHSRFEREIQLAQSSAGSPLAKQVPRVAG